MNAFLKRRLGIIIGLIAVAIAAGVGIWFSPAQIQLRRTARLIDAASQGDLKAVEAALDSGANVNSRDTDGVTVLMHAARGHHPVIEDPGPSDHPEVVELLIRRGAEVNAKTDSGFVALFWAARYGHAKVAKVLIDHGANVNAKDKDGITALRWAKTNRHVKVIELLQNVGAKETVSD